MDHAFVLVDVFTDRPFGGNQLAVFTDARGLSPRAMQALARELNFAESTFVLPPDDARSAARVRIFTPRAELPFAGHPTVGTAAVLAGAGLVAFEGDVAAFRLEEGIGDVEVAVRRRGALLSGELTLAKPVVLPAVAPDRGHVAAALSLEASAVKDAWFAGIGVPFCFVHVASQEAVDRAVLDRAAWASRIAGGWSPHLFFFAGDLASGSELHARMFAPALGIEEDPATGSAVAILIAAVAARGAQRDGTLELRIRQGVAMGRASTLEARAVKREGVVERVHVGGSVRFSGRGTMDVPDGY
jgi:trans-2,3-dihydro-3-hydroxyanthranilate isomerase